VFGSSPLRVNASVSGVGGCGNALARLRAGYYNPSQSNLSSQSDSQSHAQQQQQQHQQQQQQQQQQLLRQQQLKQQQQQQRQQSQLDLNTKMLLLTGDTFELILPSLSTVTKPGTKPGGAATVSSSVVPVPVSVWTDTDCTRLQWRLVKPHRSAPRATVAAYERAQSAARAAVAAVGAGETGAEVEGRVRITDMNTHLSHHKWLIVSISP